MVDPIMYYAFICVISFFLSFIYAYRWNKHLDVHMTIVFVMVPVCNLEYYLMYTSSDINAAIIALKMLYIGGCFLPWVITMCIANLCNIKVNRLVKMSTFLFNSLFYIFVMTIGHSKIFYKSFSIEKKGSSCIMLKEYGFFHNLYYVVIFLYLVVDLALIIFAYRRKKQSSRRILFILFLPIPINIMGYIINHYMIIYGIEIIPITYVLGQILYLCIVHRMAIYNVSDMVLESMVESGDTGFVTVDFKKRYLGSNETAREILPDLNRLIVDGPIDKTDALKETLVAWIDKYSLNQEMGKHVFYRPSGILSDDERIYSVTVNYLFDGRKRHGYQIFLEDDTQNQKYIQLIDKYNTDLQKDVAIKTERLMEMHNNLIMGMAMMVESRDNSTGGHIRRTSEGVRILIEEMKKDEKLNLSDSFCKNIIKAAPMHDLGKISVDDAVLRKAGAFTTEEREKMKKHSAEGARIVHEILKDTDDEQFRRIAENVAHYHHERVDGTGYPDGLKGNEIPLEAKIMAIADVYDALVSKRVYKEKYSFEKANEIILEGMGTQFDSSLQKYYESARPKLEAFYSLEQ